MLGFI